MHTTENVSFIIEGDMEIGEKTYKKMYYATSDETFATLENKTFYRALREEGRQVYMYDETLGDVLLFDFGMQPGESYVIGESSCLESTSSRHTTRAPSTFRTARNTYGKIFEDDEKNI